MLGVLDGVLAKQPSGWLVGGKCTIADISFIAWNRLAFNVSMKDINVEKEYPHVWAYACFPCGLRKLSDPRWCSVQVAQQDARNAGDQESPRNPG